MDPKTKKRQSAAKKCCGWEKASIYDAIFVKKIDAQHALKHDFWVFLFTKKNAKNRCPRKEINFYRVCTEFY